MLRRGAWLSDKHNEAYGSGFKMRGVGYWGGSGRLARLVNSAASRDRDVYQFGVYTGGTMRSIAKRIKNFGHLYGFDSFSGLPAETPGERLEGAHWRPGSFSAADALGEWRLSSLLARLRTSIAYANTTLIPGFFNESLTPALRRSLPFQPALLVDVDVDLHASTMDCLTWMLDHGLLVPGSFVRYDDWRNMRQGYGEARAHRELTRRFNITWRNLGDRGSPNSREWQVEAIGRRRR